MVENTNYIAVEIMDLSKLGARIPWPQDRIRDTMSPPFWLVLRYVLTHFELSCCIRTDRLHHILSIGNMAQGADQRRWKLLASGPGTARSGRSWHVRDWGKGSVTLVARLRRRHQSLITGRWDCAAGILSI